MFIISTINWKHLASVLVPGVLIAAISLYVLGFRVQTNAEKKVLPGRALAAYEDLYPIRTDHKGALYLDRNLFVEAINKLSANPSPRAIADLIYLGNSNNVTLLLDENAKEKYLKLAKEYDDAALSEVDREKDRIFQSYTDIVNAIGQTFAGTPIEIVLHDTRNPLRSIVAVQNPISGRRLGDTNTNFGVQLIKNYSQGDGRGGSSFVSYAIALKDGRSVKSSTIPIFHDSYGLIGFICINIDISKLSRNNGEYVDQFMDSFKQTMANDVISEMIQNSKRSN